MKWWSKRWRKVWAAGLAGLLLALVACGPGSGAGPSGAPAWGIDPGPGQSAAQLVQAAGEIVYDEGVIPLTQEQEGLLHGYMTAAYGALAQLAEQVGEENAAQAYIQAAPEYLSQLRRAWQEREAGREAQAVLPQADEPYDRQAALAYADRYAMERSQAWPDYSDYGGNCQNFASQCLLAGGIPMDTAGPDIWKWYGPDPSESTWAEGRSPSWSGVNQFRGYARDNAGFGLAALVDAPYYSGQPGDLIQMGTADSLYHTVVVRDLVCDNAGRTVDYLVHSNTNDMENYPASLYGYSVFSLIRIAGWNRG